MEVVITEKAKKYIDKKNRKIITVDLFLSNSGIEAALPYVYMEKPKEDINRYDKFEVEDIIVYVYKCANTKRGKIIITLSSFFFYKSLEVEGISMI